jgi:hypothetical protein
MPARIDVEFGMKPMKFALLIAMGAVLAVAIQACTDVGDDNSASPFDAGGTDQTTTGYDAPSSNQDGNGSVPGDATVPGHDSASSSLDAPAGDSTLGTPDGGGADAGTLDARADAAGTADTGTHDAGPPPDAAALNPHCAANNGGAPCTPTEIVVIEHDTNLDGTAKGDAGAFGCYDCMLRNGCLDDTRYSDSNHECGDVTGSMGINQPTLSGDDPTASCLALVTCVFANSCLDPTAGGSGGSGNCYCGTASGQQCTVPGAPNGPCLTQEQDGLDSTDPPTVNSRLVNPNYAGGMANAIFACAVANGCLAVCN